MSTKTKLDTFTQAYVECALWSSTDNSNEQGGEPLDENYGVEDIAPETLARMVEDCAQFQAEHAQLWANHRSGEDRAGHDFWLTRNRHGAGFWDGDWEKNAAKVLTDASHTWGSFDLYVGDDGLIYGS